MSQVQPSDDRRHVQILGIYHYVSGAFLFYCAALVGVGGLVTSSVMRELPSNDLLPNVSGLLVALMWGLGLLLLASAVLVVAAGYLMRRGRARLLGVGVALVQLLFNGVVGIFSLVVLHRASVRELFRSGQMAPPSRRLEVADRADAVPGSSWWRRNRGWSWPIPLLALVALAPVAAFALIFLTIFVIDGQAAPLHQAGLDLAAENAEVQSVLGAPLTLHWLRTGSTKTSADGSGTANIQLRVVGPQGRGWLNLDAARTEHEWQIREASVDLDGPSTPIVLRKRPGPCDQEEWEACSDEAAREFNHLPRDPERSMPGRLDDLARRMELACSGDYGQACENLATMHDENGEYHLDLARSVELYLRGCDLGAVTSCHRVGHMLFDGKGVEVSKARAREYFQRACDLGDADACGDLEGA